MSTSQIVTLCIAVLGAALGVVNTWQVLDKSRVKLRVRPAQAIPVGPVSGAVRFCIEVTNVSNFAVTIREVGYLYRGSDERAAYMPPILIDGGDWPRRLEPRSTVTAFGQTPDSRLREHRLKCAYARTACGVTRTGVSPALRSIAHDGASRQEGA